MQRFQAAAMREKRQISIFKEIWPNTQEWGKDVGSTYLAQGFREKDPIKIAAGAPMAVGSAFFEFPDYLWAGVVDEKLQSTEETRTWRDIKLIGNNNVRHPIRTVFSGLRLFADVPLDAGDMLFQFNHQRTGNLQNITHERAQRALVHPN